MDAQLLIPFLLIGFLVLSTSVSMGDKLPINATAAPGEVCRCGCSYQVTLCRTSDTEYCVDLCQLMCGKSVHSVKEGLCLDDKNCSCVMDDDMNPPVCAKELSTGWLQSFSNERELDCLNLCHNFKWGFEHTGFCYEKEMTPEEIKAYLNSSDNVAT